MNFKKISKYIDTKEFTTDIAVILTVGVVGFVGVYWLFKKFGLFSYNGLSQQQVVKVYTEFQRRYPVLSKVGGYNRLMGGYFERGIAGGPGQYPLYFHYSHDGKGHADFQMYPMMFETWSTDPGILGVGKFFTGRAIYP